MFNLTEAENKITYANEELIKSYLKDQGINAEQGTPIRELIVKPAASLYTQTDLLYNNIIDNLDIDTTTDETAISLLNNMGMEIEEPGLGSGVLCVYSELDTDLTIPAGSQFSVLGQDLSTLNTVIGTINNIDSLPDVYTKLMKSGDLYYLLVPVETNYDLTIDIPSNVEVSLISNIPSILKTITASSFTTQFIPTTLQELKDRRIEGVAFKTLNNPLQIDTFLKNQKLGVRDTSTVSMGDSIMNRGSLNIYGVNTGGRADIYVRSAKYLQTNIFKVTCTKNTEDKYVGVLTKEQAPGFYYIDKAVAPNGDELTNFTYQVSCDITNETIIPDCSDDQAVFSKYQNCIFTFNYSEGISDVLNFNVHTLGLPAINLIQDAVNDPRSRNVTCDLLVKAAIPCFLSAQVLISYSQGTSPPNEEVVRQVVADSISEIPMTQTYLSGSEIAIAINKKYPDVIVKLPVVFTGHILDKNRNAHYIRSNDTIKIPSEVDLGIYPTIVSFFTSPSNIEISYINDKV